jgi:hypothetical protein
MVAFARNVRFTTAVLEPLIFAGALDDSKAGSRSSCRVVAALPESMKRLSGLFSFGASKSQKSENSKSVSSNKAAEPQLSTSTLSGIRKSVYFIQKHHGLSFLSLPPEIDTASKEEVSLCLKHVTAGRENKRWK